tara:strand:- start:6052 stop:6846 length:795 start_codon:yes stop_codon:yes gene_type:complete
VSFEFLYITGSPEEAKFVDDRGVDFIFIDMEYIGKSERQPGDSVKNRHTIQNISDIKKLCNPANLLVRVNPYGGHSKTEINEAISAGATHIMVPMIASIESIEAVNRIIDGRVFLVPLIETIFSLQNLELIIDRVIPEFVYFGLNDLHRELRLNFMFEILAMGLLEYPADICRKNNIKFGFGGVTKFDYGVLNSKFILNEHMRLGSSYVIISRDFTKNVKSSEFGEQLELIRSYMFKRQVQTTLLKSSFELKFKIREILQQDFS